MKITIVANDIGPVGGMERQLRDLVLGLLDGGEEVTVIARSCDLPPAARLRWIRVLGPSRPFVIAYPWFLLVASLLVRLRRRGIVQATGAIVLGQVDVFAVHLCHRALAAAGVERFSRRALGFRVNGWLAGVMSRALERWAYRPSRARAFVAVSGGGARELASSFPAIAGMISTIHDCVDTDEFHPPARTVDLGVARGALGVPANALLAAFVGGDWERKGLELAIRALPAAPGWELLVVGPGDAPWYAQLAASLGVAERVRLLGRRTNVADLLRLCDAFLLPTAYETFSLVTYEAAASGLPLLVTPVSGIEDVLADGRTGYAIKRDAADIAARLRSLGEDPGRRTALGRAARAQSLQYTCERMVAGYRALYDELSGAAGG
jgi:glycosyltransferase involved in cell wall biosynthesis